MRFFADEGIERLIVQSLRDAGYEVDWAVEIARGAEDDEIASLATQGKSILITNDKDFGELVLRQGFPITGVMLLRMHRLSASEKASRVLRVISEAGTQLRGHFSVVTERGVRLRPLSRP
ncbi:MAG: DUF5615 family PIN-like protein [Fimbriimonadales bacterium]|nr:DUF5615 family PIN-like protein [Fimbriimonadales bacterium]